MNAQLIKYFEISFDIFYLVFIWFLVLKMYTSKKANINNTGHILKLAFLLLAIGDTGHVGFRVWAYALGGLNKTINIFNMDLKLTGLGALLTAYLVTILYMLIAKAWYEAFNKRNTKMYYFLQSLAVFRLIIMAFPQNQWGGLTVPYDWSIYRNIPMIIMGLLLATMMLIDAKKENNSIFKKFAIYIYISYLFYMPVIFWVRFIPMLGILMIPKTIAYLFMAVLVYKTYFKQEISS
jgi:hypothetical protein